MRVLDQNVRSALLYLAALTVASCASDPEGNDIEDGGATACEGAADSSFSAIDAPDGCRTCTCIDHTWTCTTYDVCECTPGDVRRNGCNTCTCGADFKWGGCTLVACPD